MTNFKTPLRGQQELTLLGSEKTTSSLVVFILFLRDFYEKKSIFRKTSAASYAVLYHASARIASALSHDVTKCVKEISMTKILSILKFRSITGIIIDMGGW